MKDYIKILDKNNIERLAEIVVIFNLEGYDFNYIIYKELDDTHTYIARYKGEDIVNLDTNLSEEELKLANIIYEGVKQWV